MGGRTGGLGMMSGEKWLREVQTNVLFGSKWLSLQTYTAFLAPPKLVGQN